MILSTENKGEFIEFIYFSIANQIMLHIVPMETSNNYRFMLSNNDEVKPITHLMSIYRRDNLDDEVTEDDIHEIVTMLCDGKEIYITMKSIHPSISINVYIDGSANDVCVRHRMFDEFEQLPQEKKDAFEYVSDIVLDTIHQIASRL